MIGFEQHQRLAVDLLQREVVGVVGAALQIPHKVHHLRYLRPSNTTVIKNQIYRRWKRQESWRIPAEK